MEREINILVIEDHPIVLEGFIKGFRKISLNNPGIVFHTKEARSCETALYILENEMPAKAWDMVLLDLEVPVINVGRYFSGEDIGLFIRKKIPTTKLVVSTSFDNNYRVQSIFKSLNPDGFLIKRDSTAKTIETALWEVINDKLFYSKHILEVIRKSFASPIWLDELDRRLLYELSIGTKTSDLSNIIPLSQASIARRKKVIKENFEIDGMSDKELIRMAKRYGFI